MCRANPSGLLINHQKYLFRTRGGNGFFLTGEPVPDCRGLLLKWADCNNPGKWFLTRRNLCLPMEDHSWRARALLYSAWNWMVLGRWRSSSFPRMENLFLTAGDLFLDRRLNSVPQFNLASPTPILFTEKWLFLVEPLPPPPPHPPCLKSDGYL
jgi:hypothetical protein